jgi:hypothetical protein
MSSTETDPIVSSRAGTTSAGSAASFTMLALVLVFAGGNHLAAQPEPTFKADGPAKIWTADGWKPVSEGSSSGTYRGPSASQLKREAEAAARQDRARRAGALNDQANVAVRAHDYREALRLFRAQQQVIDGPKVRDVISLMEALAQWTEAKTAAEYRRALNLRPDSFTADNRIFVENLERQEAAARKAVEDAAQLARDRAAGSRLNDEAADLLAAGKIDEARDKLTEARRLSPDDKQINANYWIAWANISLRNGSIDNMITYLESAVQWDPENTKAKELLIRARTDRDNQRSAVQAGLAESRSRLLGGNAPGSERTVAGAFGSRESNPTLATRPAGKIGSNVLAGDQLMSAAHAASVDQDLSVNFDIGGAQAVGSLPMVDPATMPPRVLNDPRMSESLQQLSDLLAARAKIRQDRDTLVDARNQTKDPAAMAALTKQVDAKQQEYAQAAPAIAAKQDSVAKLHRVISSEIEGGDALGGTPLQFMTR